MSFLVHTKMTFHKLFTSYKETFQHVTRNHTSRRLFSSVRFADIDGRSSCNRDLLVRGLLSIVMSF